MGGLVSSKRSETSSTEPSSYRNVLSHYEGRCEWLHDSNFLRDLESDSVDTDILDEELQSLDAREPNTCRRRTEKVLESSPLQIALCVLVILDASIVVAEILLDLQATRVQSAETAHRLILATDFIRARFTDDECHYDGYNVANMITCLDRRPTNTGYHGDASSSQPYNNDHVGSIATTTATGDVEELTPLNQRRRRRDIHGNPPVDLRSMPWPLDTVETVEMCRRVLSIQSIDIDDRRHTESTAARSSGTTRGSWSSKTGPTSNHDERVPAWLETSRREHESTGQRTFLDRTKQSENKRNTGRFDNRERTALLASLHRNYRTIENLRRVDVINGNPDSGSLFAPPSGSGELQTESKYKHPNDVIKRRLTSSRVVRSAAEPEVNQSDSLDDVSLPPSLIDRAILTSSRNAHTMEGRSVEDASTSEGNKSDSTAAVTESTYQSDGHGDQVAALFKVAHALHYASIAILGIFVIQVLVKAIASGTHFIRQKLEVFDSIVIFASFALDVVFFDGVTDANGEHAATLILIFLLWRILRIINGLMIANQKRQEFRIKLQKRARTKMEKKLEILRDDVAWHEKQAVNLKGLCAEKGASEDELSMCRPRRMTIVQTSTLTGLSSIASLSLGLSMSMTGGGAAATSAAMLRNRLMVSSGMETLNHGRPRRASLAPLLNGCSFSPSSSSSAAAATAATVRSESRLTSLFASSDGGHDESQRAISSPFSTHYRPWRRQSAVCQTTTATMSYCDSRMPLLTQPTMADSISSIQTATTVEREADDNDARLGRATEEDPEDDKPLTIICNNDVSDRQLDNEIKVDIVVT